MWWAAVTAAAGAVQLFVEVHAAAAVIILRRLVRQLWLAPDFVGGGAVFKHSAMHN
jgi:hypothetical protein